MQQKQQTLKQSLTFTGRGLHTGLQVEMAIEPAPVNHGVKFQRVDLPEQPIIEAIADNVTATSRGTTLEKNNVKISTIEHVLAALSGMGVDNALVKVDAPEAPIMDGSARLYVEGIIETGVEEQNEDRWYFEIKEKFVYRDEAFGKEITLLPDDKFSMEVMIDYNSEVIGNQYARMNDVSEFATGIAPCRTFVFLHELEPLFKNNLIKGGDLDNAIVIVE
ncbi:MAG: UDP-3-O-acyl-N-acetylglucosamine deacetylase, partial [Prevotellaceae bacterium]|nr:UDP-3-O-acyl-N-acetylglucosamine deacetylase [Prevotellaceae bacterium]